MKLDTFRRLDDHARRIRQLERTEPDPPGSGGGGSTAWADITGKPTSFPPDEHDPTHDDRFALIAHTHPAHADSDHDDRFSQLAHVHAVAWADITSKPSTFAPSEHDSDHNDVFSPLAHTHPAGAAIHTGAGVPAAGTGSVGDFYVDTAGDDLYGPKSATGFGPEQRITILSGPPTNSVGGSWEFGVRVTFARAGRVTKLRYQRNAAASATLNLNIWNAAGVRVVGPLARTDPAVGTYEVTLATPLAVAAASTWTFSVGGSVLPINTSATSVTETEDCDFIGHYYGGSSGAFPATTPNPFGTLYIEPVYEADIGIWPLALETVPAGAPTPQALDWLTDVATAGQANTNVLTYNGSSWAPAAIPAQTWASITGKPSTFPPTTEVLALSDLVDVDASAAADGKVLTYDSTAPAGWKAEPPNGLPAGGTAGQQLVKASSTDYDADWETVGGGAVGIPPGGLDGQSLVKTSSTDYAVDWELLTTDWSNVTGKPSTFPPTSHDSDHDDRFSQLAHTHTADSWTTITGKPSTFPPDEHDTAHDDRFSLLAHTHAAHADSDHDDRFALIDHDTAHDDRFSLLAHTHAGPAELGYAQVTSNVSVTATTSATSQLVVALGAITYTAVPHEFEWFSPFVSTAATVGTQVHLGLYDGSASTPLGRVTVRNPEASASNGWPVLGKLRLTPSAGSHTYQIRTYTTTTGGTVSAGAAAGDVITPAYLKVTRL